MGDEIKVMYRTEDHIANMQKVRNMRVRRAKDWCEKQGFIYCNSTQNYFLYKKTEADYTNSKMFVDLW